MLSYLIQFWETTLIVFVVLLELITKWIDRNKHPKISFEFKEMPVLRPIRIPTKGRGVLSGIWLWLSKPRKWELAEDFYYSVNQVDYVIPAGFQCDGTSIPKFLQTLLSPTGILLIGGIVHDYGYRYQCLTFAAGNDAQQHNQEYFDKLFRDINIQVNGFNTINRIPYYMLRLFGFVAWNKRRKADNKGNNE